MLGVYTTLIDLRRYLKLNMFSIGTRLWLSMMRPKYNLLKIVSKIMKEGIYSYRSPHKLKNQAWLIKRREFDALIILDACRYDVFSEVVYKYLDGRLDLVVSPGSTTIEWLKHTWGNSLWKDVVYVSASPLVNKRGLIEAFDARNRFLDVIEVWDWGWDEKLCTVPPYNVNLGVKIALTSMKLQKLAYPRDYKLVIHYVQPHAPYIALRHVVEKITKDEELSRSVTDVAVRKLGRFTGDFSIDYILLGLLKDVLKDEEKVKKTLFIMYRQNLEWVLKYVAELSIYLNGKIIVTADHGELLGEYGLYFHLDLPLPILREVPWFIVK